MPLAASMRRKRSSGRPASRAKRSSGSHASGGEDGRGLGSVLRWSTCSSLPADSPAEMAARPTSVLQRRTLHPSSEIVRDTLAQVRRRVERRLDAAFPFGVISGTCSSQGGDSCGSRDSALFASNEPMTGLALVRFSAKALARFLPMARGCLAACVACRQRCPGSPHRRAHAATCGSSGRGCGRCRRSAIRRAGTLPAGVARRSRGLHAASSGWRRVRRSRRDAPVSTLDPAATSSTGRPRLRVSLPLRA